MSKLSKLEAAAAAAVADRQTDTEARQGAAAGGKASTGGDRPIRTTIDLSPIHHRQLATFTSTAQAQLGLVDLPKAKVWRALLDELDADPKLAERVIERIRKQS